jgi:organic hydroperoxide reductase OsmC/OhrA
MKTIPYKELVIALASIVAFLGLILLPEILVMLIAAGCFSLLLTGIVSTERFHNYHNKNAREALKRAHRIERKH